MNAHATPAPAPLRHSFFPGRITAGRARTAADLRRHADRVDRRDALRHEVESIENAARLRWNNRPTDAQAGRLPTLAARYVACAVLARALRALADLHDACDVPAPLFAVTTDRHLAVLLAPDSAAAEAGAPLGPALAWTRTTGTRRASAIVEMAALLGRLDPHRPFPLPASIARHLATASPTPPETPPDSPDAALVLPEPPPEALPSEARPPEPAPNARPPEAPSFEAWTAAVDAVAAEDPSAAPSLVAHFTTLPWREAFDAGLAPERAAAVVVAWTVGCAVFGPRPFAWSPPPFEPRPEPLPPPAPPRRPDDDGPDDTGRGGETPPGSPPRSGGAPLTRTDPAPPDAPTPPGLCPADARTAGRLDTQADRLAERIHRARNLHDGQTLTPRRARVRAAGQHEADALEPVLDALRALALATRAGTLPAVLAHVTTRAAASEIVPRFEGHTPEYPEADTPFDRACRVRLLAAGIRDADDFAEALAALASLPRPEDGRGASDREAARVRSQVEAARLAGILDYFFSPPAVADALLDAAALPDAAGPAFRVLDPSAGDGALLDAVRARLPRATVAAVEINARLRDILAAKGHALVGDDALAFADADGFDRIVMNPPFGRGGALAMQHVRHAYGLLRPGGRLVAVVPESCFFRADRAHRDFRDWLHGLGGYDRDLPHEAFTAAGTQVSTRLVVVDAP